MKGIKKFLIPKSITELLDVLEQNCEDVLILGGGTHVELQKKSPKSIIVDITKTNLNYIKTDEQYIKIGATTRVADIINDPLLKKFANGILVKSACRIGNTLTKNLVTIGGNLYTSFPWSNFPPALLVLDAKVKLANYENSREIELEYLLKNNPKKIIQKNELITEILIPRLPVLLTNYKTFSFTESDFDLAIVATSVIMENKICKHVKVAIGSALVPCSLIYLMQDLLLNREFNIEVINEAVDKTMADIKLVKNFRTSPEHLKEVVKTLLRRSFLELSSST